MTVDPGSGATGFVVAAADLDGVAVPDGVLAVWGEDWDGNATIRAVRAGAVTVLRGKHGERFDVDGPCASLCSECSELIVAAAPGAHVVETQRHYRDAHGRDLPLLP